MSLMKYLFKNIICQMKCFQNDKHGYICRIMLKPQYKYQV